MRVSLGEVSKYLDFYLPSVEKVVDKIGLQLGAVDEGVFDLSEVYKDVLIVKVIEAKPIKNTDHLNLCLIDDGGKLNIKRNKDGFIQVVCGAPNVREGILTAYLPPESIVPITFYKDQFKLEVKNICGNNSYGMLCSLSELAISDEHNGIVELKNGKPGDSFAANYELNDVVVDIENKMFTHRPDCFGQIGVAREVSGIFSKQFHSPKWYKSKVDIKQDDSGYPFHLENKYSEKVPRLSAISLSSIKIAESPLELKILLSKLGIRPINNIVDITNIVMLQTAQPLHAYDYQKLKELSMDIPVLEARHAKENEKIQLLGGKDIKLSKEDIVIATDKNVVGLAGIMGASNSEVDANTTAIILESACFDMFALRKTSMRVGLFTDALARFNKGQSSLQQLTALYYAVDLIKKYIPGAMVSSNTIDINSLSSEQIESDSIYPAINISVEYINSRLGTVLTTEEIKSILENTEFSVRLQTPDKLSIKAPFYRTDIKIREDLVEEVGRLYGYQNIKDTELIAPMPSPIDDPFLKLKSQIRNRLKNAGANELLNYSFVSGDQIEKSNQDIKKAYKISNPLSPAHQYYRLSITPSLLGKVHQNIKNGFEAFALFELGSVHDKTKKDGHIPASSEYLSLVYVSKQAKIGAAYYYSVKYLDYLLSGIVYDLIPFKDHDVPKDLVDLCGVYQASRSALVMVEGEIIGIVGEFKDSIYKDFKLPQYLSGYEINIAKLVGKIGTNYYIPKSKFPQIKQDITLATNSIVNYSTISVELVNSLGHILKNKNAYYIIDYLGSYQKDKTQVNYSFRITLGDYDQTLEDKEVNIILDDTEKLINKTIKVKRI